jgi:hypothetical protein
VFLLWTERRVVLWELRRGCRSVLAGSHRLDADLPTFRTSWYITPLKVPQGDEFIPGDQTLPAQQRGPRQLASLRRRIGPPGQAKPDRRGARNLTISVSTFSMPPLSISSCGGFLCSATHSRPERKRPSGRTSPDISTPPFRHLLEELTYPSGLPFDLGARKSLAA